MLLVAEVDVDHLPVQRAKRVSGFCVQELGAEKVGSLRRSEYLEFTDRQLENLCQREVEMRRKRQRQGPGVEATVSDGA